MRARSLVRATTWQIRYRVTAQANWRMLERRLDPHTAQAAARHHEDLAAGDFADPRRYEPPAGNRRPEDLGR